MSDEIPDDLEYESRRATIRAARYAVIGIIIALVTLAWTVAVDLSKEDKNDNPVDANEQSREEESADVENSPEMTEGSHPNDGLKAYFYRAQHDYENWKGEQTWWQLSLWWIVMYAFGMILAANLESWIGIPVVTQLLYLSVFWTSLSGFGIILSTVLWVALPLALILFLYFY